MPLPRSSPTKAIGSLYTRRIQYDRPAYTIKDPISAIPPPPIPEDDEVLPEAIPQISIRGRKGHNLGVVSTVGVDTITLPQNFRYSLDDIDEKSSIIRDGESVEILSRNDGQLEVGANFRFPYSGEEITIRTPGDQDFTMRFEPTNESPLIPVVFPVDEMLYNFIVYFYENKNDTDAIHINFVKGIETFEDLLIIDLVNPTPFSSQNVILRGCNYFTGGSVKPTAISFRAKRSFSSHPRATKNV